MGAARGRRARGGRAAPGWTGPTRWSAWRPERADHSADAAIGLPHFDGAWHVLVAGEVATTPEAAGYRLLRARDAYTVTLNPLGSVTVRAGPAPGSMDPTGPATPREPPRRPPEPPRTPRPPMVGEVDLMPPTADLTRDLRGYGEAERSYRLALAMDLGLEAARVGLEGVAREARVDTAR